MFISHDEFVRVTTHVIYQYYGMGLYKQTLFMIISLPLQANSYNKIAW